MKTIEINQEQLNAIFNSQPPTKGQLYQMLGLNPDKSILLMGKTGVGKTYSIVKLHNLMPPLHERYNLSSNLLEANDIVNKYAVWYSSGMKTKHPLDYMNEYNLVIDDLGNEQEKIVIYGSEVYPIKQLLVERHKSRKLLRTHITTNLDVDSLYKRLDDRIMSRLYEMCNFVELTGTDYRIL